MRGLLARRIAAVVMSFVFVCSVVPAVAGDIVSTMRNVNAVGEAQGFRINPAFDRAADRGPDDLSQPQAFEILRPLDKGVTIGRLYTSCTCIQLEAPKRSFEPGERAVLQLRNIKETPVNGQIYAIYVQITSPVRATLRFDTFVQSNSIINPPRAESAQSPEPDPLSVPAPADDAVADAIPAPAADAVAADNSSPMPEIEVIVPRGPLDEAEEETPEAPIEEKEAVEEKAEEEPIADSDPLQNELRAARDELDAIMQTRSADLSTALPDSTDTALDSYFEEQSAKAEAEAAARAAVSASGARLVTGRTAPVSDPSLHAISLITIGCRDMARSIAFYEAIGWKRVARTKYDAAAFFQLRGQVLALYPLADMLKEQNMADARPAPGGISLAVHVRSQEEVEATYRRFIDAGGVSLQAPTAMPSGSVTCYVADPDGNPWEISWVPQFVLDDNGGLWLQSQ